MTDRRSTAARRLDLGLALRDAGEPAAAAEALAAACEADPDYAEAHFARAEALAASGDQAGAADAFRRYLALEPSDRMGATPRLALLDAAPTPTRLPAAYVAALFDEYAPRFDQALQGALAYRAPEHLGAALMRRLDSLPNAGTARGLDLGCGTGLVGRAVRLALGALDGIDLSEEMLKRAAATGLYDALVAGDLAARPLPAPHAPYELIVAGDALNYLGDLAGVFVEVAGALSPEGLFLFTLEAETDRRGEAAAGFRLHEGCRYRHEEAAVRAWLQAAGFETLEVERPVLRREKRRDVTGLLFVARRLSDAAQPGAPARKPPRTRPEA